VLSFERWVDSDAEDSHWQTPHLKHAIGAMGDILERDPEIFKAANII
jgi:quinol monooxygenase YgiN